MPSSARCTNFREGRPAAAKREAGQCDDHPDEVGTIRHGTAASTSQKTQACPKASPNRSRHRSADPRRAEGHCTGARQAPFSFGPCTARFLFGQDRKENGGCIPLDKPPAGADPPAIGQKTRHRRIRSNSSGTAPPPRAEWAHFQLYFPQFYISSRAGTIWNSFSDNYRPSPRWRS